MSVPSATVSPPTVAVNVTFELPSIETLPDKSPAKVIVRAVAQALAVLALPVKAPVKPVDVTLVKPANVVELAPNAIAVVPIVVLLFTNLALAILPANIVFVTVPVSPVVITVPAVAGKLIAVVPATAGAVNVTAPLVEPFNTELAIERPVPLACRTAEPNLIVLPLRNKSRNLKVSLPKSYVTSVDGIK